MPAVPLFFSEREYRECNTSGDDKNDDMFGMQQTVYGFVRCVSCVRKHGSRTDKHSEQRQRAFCYETLVEFHG